MESLLPDRPEQLLELVLTAVLQPQVGYYSRELACQWLDLDVPEPSRGYARPAYGEALFDHATRGRAEAAEVAAALWAASHETAVPYDPEDWDHPANVAYFNRLQEAGYELTDIEQDCLTRDDNQDHATGQQPPPATVGGPPAPDASPPDPALDGTGART